MANQIVCNGNNWGIATQEPDLGHRRLVNLINAWSHEMEMIGGMGINSIP